MTANLIQLPTVKTGRLYTLGNTRQPSRIWIALHGYGHLASYFIRKFAALDNGKNLVVCPEGLHRFYLNGHNGRVGASWMTKEAREDDIADNMSWLNTIENNILSSYPDAQVVLLGFSQGAATAFRWLAKKNQPITFFVNYASQIPPDIDIKAVLNSLVSTAVFFVCGDSDEFMGEDERDAQLQLLSESGKKVLAMGFNGGHIIDSTTLLNLNSQMDTLTPFC
jgi:predicted esterase